MNSQIFQVMFYLLKLTHPKLLRVTARIPLAQAKIESANWGSPLYLGYNNMFGMTQPQARKTASLGPYKSPKGVLYATFRSPLDSIRDYLLWLEAFQIYTDEGLFAHIKSAYAKDPAYQQKVAKVADSLTGELISPTAFLYKTATLVVGAIVAGWLAISTVKKLSK